MREESKMGLRKVDLQSRGWTRAVFQCPDTGHWADWRDADAVVFHGTLVAYRDEKGCWREVVDGPNDTPEDRRVDGRRYGGLRSVGISTKTPHR